jgi:5-methylcytosine-specific restriction protein A
MNHPFILGQSYERSALIAFVGSKQSQSGIIWGSKQPGVVIVTSGGRHASNAGYHDGLNDDGTWTYIGQGEKGDQDPNSFANKILVEGEKSVLLFLTMEPSASQVRARGNWKKLYTFKGEFCSGSWDIYIPSEGRRHGDRLINFTFVPVSEGLATEEPSVLGPLDLESRDVVEMRAALRKLESHPRKGGLALKDYFMRSSLVREYAKTRAGGACEFCNFDAPFLTTSGEPFLEVHHILRLADDGPDAPQNVAALCPNCHRAAHHSAKAYEMRLALLQRIHEKEAAVSLSPSSQ